MWALAGLAFSVSVVLTLIFPQKRLIEQATHQERTDALTVSYLTNLLRTDPDNIELRLQLADKKLQIGELREAQQILAPVFAGRDEAAKRRARLTEFRIREVEAYRLPEGSPARVRRVAELGAQVAALAQYDWDVATQVRLARAAAALRQPGVAAQLYSRLAAHGGAGAREWLLEGAKSALGAGEYRLAAGLYFRVQERAQSRDERREYFLTGVKTLQAGNLLGEALIEADNRIGELADDDATLLVLVRLARAANDLPRAQAYMKRFMHMSWPARAAGWIAAAGDWLVPAAHAAADDDKPRLPPAGMRPFDDEHYRLAFDVFVGGRNLDDAYRVAEAAVRQVPDNLAWRERLAQVAEWSGRPAEGLRQWLTIARRTGAEKAWQAVLRLAPGLSDDEALLAAWQHMAETNQVTGAQWARVAEAFERLGRPREAIDYLEPLLARRADPALLETLARLHERSGDAAGAIEAYRRLIATAGATRARVLTLATLLIARGEFSPAYDALQGLRGKVDGADLEYWQMLAELAWQLQRDDTALDAYRALANSGKFESSDIFRLVTLLREREPQEALRVAEFGWLKLGEPALFITALETAAGLRDQAALRRLFAALTPAQQRAFEANAQFYVLRARFHQDSGEARLALADIRRAAALNPTTDNKIAVLWFLVDHQLREELKRELAARAFEAQADPAFAGVFAAGYLALGEPRRALPFMAQQLRTSADDYLWLLGYADTLEQAGDAAMALRMRRHAWVLARTAPPVRDAQAGQRMLAYARLATLFAPGDTSLAVMQRLLRQDFGAVDGGERTLDAQARELALAWAISTEQTTAAKYWLWKNYARAIAKPAWAELAVALAEDDVDVIERVLDGRAEDLSPEGRVEAARRTQRIRQAQTLVFEALEGDADNDSLHLQLTGTALLTASSASYRHTQFDRGVLSGSERAAVVSVWLSPRLRLSTELIRVQQASRDYTTLAGVPALDRQIGLSLLRRHDFGESSLGVFRREGLTDFTGLKFTHLQRVADGITAIAGLAHNDKAIETTPLLVGGMKDQADATILYSFSKREYLRTQLFAARFHTQDGSYLGSGRGLNWETGYRVRTEYPDLTVRLAGSIQRYARSGAGDARTAQLTPTGTVPAAGFFVPQDFSVFGAYVGFGQFYRDNYARGLKPFADIGITHNNVTGKGYSGLFGAGGSVLGHDHAAVYLQVARGGTGTSDSIRELGLRYYYFFDRY